MSRLGNARERRTTLCMALLGCIGCASTPAHRVQFGEAMPSAPVAGLSACESDGPAVVRLDPRRPLTLLVHGCNSSAGRFRTLAQVFEAHGQQTLCFSYDDRDRLEHASAQFVQALEFLEDGLDADQITVLGHSQGGLVARRALVSERAQPLRSRDGSRYRLVTVSSPFAGIRSSRDCGKTWLHVVTLGVTLAVCHGIAGDKWREIFPGAEWIEQPGSLGPQVDTFVRIVTDERGTCRERREDGRCKEDDFVFSVAEQKHEPVDSDPRVLGRELKAGHVEIVGERGTAPTKLIRALQDEGILAPTPPEQEQRVARLLARLY